MTLAALALALAPRPVLAAGKTFENSELKYRIELPDQCRHVEGPGTLEAVCAPDLDTKASAAAAMPAQGRASLQFTRRFIAAPALCALFWMRTPHRFAGLTCSASAY